MQKFSLDQPFWQGAGAILTLFGILVAVWIYWLQKPKKSLSLFVSEPRPLLNLQSSFNHGIEVTANGTKIIDPRWVVIRIVNSGRVEIEKADFDTPINVAFASSAVVHSALVAETTPVQLPVVLQIDRNAIHVSPLLLNPQDAFEVQCLLSGKLAAPDVTARIKGIKALTTISNQEYLGVQKKSLLDLHNKVMGWFIAFALVVAMYVGFRELAEAFKTFFSIK